MGMGSETARGQRGVAGRENGFSTRRRIAIVRQLTREYRRAMRRLAAMGTLDVWYARASIADLRELLRSQASARQLRRFDKTVAKGRRKDHARAFAKLAVADDGEPRIRADPPLIVPIADLVDRPATRRLERGARALVDSYLTSCPTIAGDGSSATATPISRARSSGWGASGRAAG
jgi:Uncharacterized protein conserved in bacteria (DUF2252)